MRAPALCLLLLAACRPTPTPATTIPAGASGDVVLPPCPGLDPCVAAVGLLEAATPVERVRGAHAAIDLGDPALAPALEAALAREGDPELRVVLAIATLRLEGPPGAEATGRSLRHADARVRRAAADAAGWRGLGDAGPLAPLLADADPAVRTAAAEACDRLGPAAARAALARAAAGGGPEAARALLALGGCADPEADAAIVRALREPGLRGAAEDAAVRRGAAAVPWLVAALDGEPAGRAGAARALRVIGGAAAADALRPVLADADVRVRREAAQGMLAAEAAAHATLLAALAQEADVHVRGSLLRAIARHAAPGDASRLAPLAAAPSGPLTASALEALGAAGGPDALAAIRQAAGRDDAESQRGVAGAAAARPDAALEACVTPTFRHTEYTVRAAAVAAARAAGPACPPAWRDALAALVRDPVPSVRTAAGAALATIDPAEAARVVAAGLAAADGETRGRAAESLRHLAGPPGAALVRSVLAAPAADAEVLREACAAVAALGLRDQAAACRPLLHPAEPVLWREVRLAACGALGAVGGATEVVVLVPLVEDPDRPVRLAAAVAVLRLLGVPPAALEAPERRPVRLPHAVRRWWAANAGRPASAWTPPDVPVLPSA